MKILTVVGARPQFIKASVVSRAIINYNNEEKTSSIKEVLVHTGQHYEANMSDVFFAEMQIPQPDYHLGIAGSSHGAMTGRMLEKIEEVILQERPDLVLVYGDTNSTLAGALASVKLHIPIAHVESGLRSFKMNMPEEVNRVLTDQISQWLFCPTDTAVKNLQNEGIGKKIQSTICNVGDVMYDAVLFYREIAKPTQEISALIAQLNGEFYLATVHRAENTDNPGCLSNIMSALDLISKTTPVVLPLHPRTRKFLQTADYSQIKLIDPVGYFDIISLLSSCKAVFTDSGGLQKESYFFHKPCVTLRDETEWVELIEHDFNILVGSDRERIFQAEQNFIPLHRDFGNSLYGTGQAGNKIIKILAKGY